MELFFLSWAKLYNITTCASEKSGKLKRSKKLLSPTENTAPEAKPHQLSGL